MIELEIPGAGMLSLRNIVLDFNGTVALDGKLLPGVKERLCALSENLEVYILTADTFGTCKKALSGVKCSIEILDGTPGAEQKKMFVRKIGAGETVSFGNGMNDCLMLAESALGILVIGPEGSFATALKFAKIVVMDIRDGLDMLLNPKRLVATLRY